MNAVTNAPDPAPVAPDQHWTRYTPEQVTATLVTLAEHRGNVRATARTTGIPASTIRMWRDGQCDPNNLPSAETVQLAKATRAVRWNRVTEAALDVVEDTVDDLSAYQAALVAGIAEDKAALLRGDTGPVADPETLARLELFRKHYAAAQQLQVHQHLHLHMAPGAPTEPAPVPVEVKALEQGGGAEK
jgi:hypothetical protein